MKKFIKNKLVLVILIIFFLIVYLLFFLFIYNKKFKNNTSDIDTIKSPPTFNIQINNNPSKIKITNWTVEDSSPFVCFISDKSQIQNCETVFNSLSLEKFEYSQQLDPIYVFEFCGNNNIIVSIFSNNVLHISNAFENISEYYIIFENDLPKILELTDVKYYLHQSDLDLPSSSLCTNVQNKLLVNTSSSDISILKKQIHSIHSSLEFHLVDRVQSIKNANSFYWEFEIKDQIVVQPNGVLVQSYGFWQYRDSLKELSCLNINDNLKQILDDIIYRIELCINNHDLSEAFEVHKILHDLDYWTINYPISSFSVAPADWGGLTCYYGLMDKLDY